MVTNKLLEHIRFIFFWSCGSRNSHKTRVATEVYSFCSIYFFLNSKNQATCSSRNSGKILKIGNQLRVAAAASRTKWENLLRQTLN